MTNRTTPFFLAVVAGAVASGMLLPTPASAFPQDELTAVVVLGVLALAAELLAFLMPRGVVGSNSAMPILAGVMISPSWYSVMSMVVVVGVAESNRKSEFPKAVFNIAQYGLSVGLASLVYLRLGGVPLYDLGKPGIADLTLLVGIPAVVAFTVAMTTNTALVSVAIAIRDNVKVASAWNSTALPKIGVDVLSTPLIFVFGWVFARYGPMASAAMWVPIIGLRQLVRTNVELERTNVELLDLMVKSIEARDPYTSGHSRRVQDYSMAIARALGLGERQVQLVGRAALLHDIGKIHEKYGPILRKADRLSADEWNTMREHPSDGAELIATMTPLRELVSAVRHHHENWDGTGYPNGLAGELIPLPARIIRFADTIDAMTTVRPYRPSLSPAEVRAEIVRCRGSQFDPGLVDRLLSSPAWRTLLGPDAANVRYGELGIIGNEEKRRWLSA